MLFITHLLQNCAGSAERIYSFQWQVYAIDSSHGLRSSMQTTMACLRTLFIK